MIFMNKIHNHPQLLPTSVTQTISPDSPSPKHPTDYSSDWYLKYNCTPYNQRPVFVAIFLPKFRGTAKLQNGQFRGNFAVKIADFAVISR